MDCPWVRISYFRFPCYCPIKAFSKAQPHAQLHPQFCKLSSLGDQAVSVAFKTWSGVGMHPKSTAEITQGISHLGFYLPNRFLGEFVMNVIRSIYLIPYRIVSHKPVAGNILKSINEREREREGSVENTELKVGE